MKANTRILLVAIAAGLLGAVVSFMVAGPGFLYRTDAGQALLQSAMSATAPPPPAGVVVAKRGERIPDLQLPGLDDRPMALPAEFAGRPLLINFWASWCGPCIQEMPELQRFSSNQASNGVQVVGIALDDQASVEAFLRRVPVSYPILMDVAGPADSGVRLGNVKGVLPFTVLVSADGKLVKQRLGPFRHGEIDGWAAPGTTER